MLVEAEGRNHGNTGLSGWHRNQDLNDASTILSIKKVKRKADGIWKKEK